jgi:tripartite-type tricarboxylate transporter receptor subunit TctC
MELSRVRNRLQVAATALVLACNQAMGAGFPERPITIVSPFAPGGADAFLRMFAPKFGEYLGQSVVIENVPGAGGALGTERAARARADGYTLLFSPASVSVTGRFLSKNWHVDVLKDFAPITLMHETPQVLFVHPSLPVTSVKELVAYAKDHRRKLAYGSAGTGSVMHFNGEMFNLETGADLLQVPYKGTAPMMNDTLAGRVQVGFSTLASVIPYSNAGKLRILAVLEPKRNVLLPGVPSINETLPNFKVAGTWSALLAPAGLPKEIQTRLSEAAVNALRSPEVKTAFEQNFAQVIASSPPELTERLRADIDRMEKIVKIMGIQAE